MIVFVPRQYDLEQGRSSEGRSALSQADSQDVERDEGMLVEEMSANGIGAFQPDMMFESLARNYAHAEKLYGKRLIALASGHDAEYVKRNIRIPEFKELLKKRLEQTHEDLKRKGLLEDGTLTDEAYILAAQRMLTQEVERLHASSFNETRGRARGRLGEVDDHKPYRHDAYRDIDVRRSIRMAVRRGHEHIMIEDVRAVDRVTHPECEVLFAVDFSGSMKGDKVAKARRAFFSLSAGTLRNHDPIGLLIFGMDERASFPIGSAHADMLTRIVQERPEGKTALSFAIDRASELFSSKGNKKHIILVTDIQPTHGSDPIDTMLVSVSNAKMRGISISILGIGADAGMEVIAQMVAEETGGSFYRVDEDSLGQVVLLDYFMQR